MNETEETSNERIAEAVVLSVISGLAFIGNLSLWIIVCVEKCLRTPSNILILSLSAADLLVSIYIYMVVSDNMAANMAAYTNMAANMAAYTNKAVI